MRKTPRFTPKILQRFTTEGRGHGTYTNYIAWHQVRRSDPSSMGRSHIQNWRGRQHDLLSDQELMAFLFSTMHPEVVDIREQMPLQLEAGRHELAAYCIDTPASSFPGTIEIAEQMGIKHPIVRYRAETAHWVMTTDLLLTLKNASGNMRLLAISVKPSELTPEKCRSMELLSLEREYWAHRGVPWLFITSNLYDSLVGERLRATSDWAWGDAFNASLLDWMVEQKHRFDRRTLTQILDSAVTQCGSMQVAQDTFWRGIWTGRLHFDLRRSWRPSAPFVLISPSQFWKQNPIVSERSSWSH